MALPDLTTVDAVKAYAAIAGDTTDSVLQALVTAYSGWVRAWLNRDITSNDYDIRRSGRGSCAMQMPQYPITAVTLLEIDGSAIPEQQTWGQPGFYYDEEQIALVGHCFSRGVANIHIQFTAGYATIPVEIAQAVNELVALRFRLRDKNEWSSMTLANQSVSTLITKEMPSSVATLLANYRCVAPL